MVIFNSKMLVYQGVYCGSNVDHHNPRTGNPYDTSTHLRPLSFYLSHDTYSLPEELQKVTVMW